MIINLLRMTYLTSWFFLESELVFLVFLFELIPEGGRPRELQE